MHRATATAAAVALCWPAAASAQDLQFMQFATRGRTTQIPFGAGFSGYAVGGDLDGDGISDLVVTFGFQVAVLLGTAHGWGTPALFVNRTLQRPVLIDLDGDGDRDVAFVPPNISTACTVLLYENRNGLVPVALPSAMTGSNATVRGVAIGDVDGNGFADMIVAPQSGSVFPQLVLVRGGTGLQFTIDLAAMPAAPALGLWPALIDADGDGRPDVLASNATSGLRLLHNTGGSFVDATASLPATRTGHTFLVTADLDGDGRDDCAATVTNGDIDVLWGVPGGGLTFAAAVASVPGVRTLWPADFDGDGDLDLLAEQQGGLDVLWNLGGRQFARAQLLRDTIAMFGVADMDHDGVADVPFTTPEAYALTRCKWRARFEDAAFALGLPPMPATTQVAVTCAGDVDGDGHPDLVTPVGVDVKVDLALGGGVYRRTTSPAGLTDGGGMWRSLLADMDNDGDLDLVVRTDARLAVASNDGAGTFAWTMTEVAQSSGGPDDLRVADVDGDGDRDIVLADGRGITLRRNLGGGLFAQPVVIVPPSTVPQCVELSDVDGDGDLDVVSDVSAGAGLTHVIAANDGQGNFAANPAFSVNLGTAPVSLCAADFDGDGDLDLAAASGGLGVYRNDGHGVFTDRTPFDLPSVAGTPVSNLIAADLDDDGDTDLAVFLSLGLRMLLLINDGTGRFVDRSANRCPILSFPGGQFGYANLRATDIDGDGDVDLAIADHNNRFLWINTVRHCRSNVAPRIGGTASIDLLSGPGFGSNGTALLGVGFALAAPPIAIPGFAGQLQIDPSTLQIAAAVQTSPVGVSSVFVPVPAVTALVGLEVWLQGAILPSSGRAGLTNAVYEVVLPP